MDRVPNDTSLHYSFQPYSTLYTCAVIPEPCFPTFFFNHSAYPYIFLHFYYYIVSVLIESTNYRIIATPKNSVMQCIMYKKWNLMGERVLARECTVWKRD